MNEWMPTAPALQERGAWPCPGSQLRYLMPEVHVPRRGYFQTEGEEGLSCGRLVGSSGLETSCDAPPSKAKPQQLLTPSPCNPNDHSGNGIGSWGTTSDIPEHRHTKLIKQHPSPPQALQFHVTVPLGQLPSFSGALFSCAHGAGLSLFHFVLGTLVIHCPPHEC